MGKFTDALKKAAQERLNRIEKIEEKTEVKYEFIAHKTVESNIDARIVTFFDPQSPVTEQYRTLRTNLTGLSTNKPIKSLTITSSTHGEGKTITAINLAVSMAQDLNNKSILLIDADLRRSKVSKYLGMPTHTGLAELLANGSNFEESLLNIGIKNLTVLPAGKAPQNPAELLGSAKMKILINSLKERFDFLILDAPPIVPVTDAGLIGIHTDGAIMVVQANRTQKGVIKHAEGMLRQSQTKLLGYILTNIRYHIPAYIYRYL